MRVRVYQNTNFGNNELVWNVPHPDYDFDGNHDYVTFNGYEARHPLLTSMISISGQYTNTTAFFDYLIITDDEDNKMYYFINSIVAERNDLLFGVTLDAITTYGMLGKAISGTIIRKHDTNMNEHRFDYPSLLSFQGNYQNEYYAYVGYSESNRRFIESAIDLTKINPAISINAQDGSKIVVPVLAKPAHFTNYIVESWSGYITADESRALTLYDANPLNPNVLNEVRGLAGDGAISDSYEVPSDAIYVEQNGAEVYRLNGKFKLVELPFKLSAMEGTNGWVPQNLAIRGMVSVAIMSITEKTRATFPGWDLKESVNSEGDLRVNLWCDPKPSGAPYCSPDQVLSLHPKTTSAITPLATLELKSVRGSQWLKNPLIYSSGRGETFASVETQLEREKSAYEQKVALNQLELARQQREIEIAQQDFQNQQAIVGGLIGGGAAILSKDLGGAINAAKGVYETNVNMDYIEKMRVLKGYEQETQKTLINMAHTNNLRNLNVQEAIRRVVPTEVVWQRSESLSEYAQYNGFLVSLIIPDVESLKSKDMEFTKYGYPCYESVSHFIMLDHLRQNHTVYQFENPLVEIGGNVGDMIRSVLESGIRILSKPYTSFNILNNPKVGD